MELAIHWSPTNVHQVLALVDIRAECTLLYGNPDKSLGLEASSDGYRRAQCKDEDCAASPEYW